MYQRLTLAQWSSGDSEEDKCICTRHYCKTSIQPGSQREGNKVMWKLKCVRVMERVRVGETGGSVTVAPLHATLLPASSPAGITVGYIQRLCA